MSAPSDVAGAILANKRQITSTVLKYTLKFVIGIIFWATIIAAIDVLFFHAKIHW
jgi:hypothetical protein